MAKKKKYYFVSYAYNKGFGCRAIIINDDVFFVNEVAEFIKQNNLKGESNVVILYYKELSKKEYYAQVKGGDQ